MKKSYFLVIALNKAAVRAKAVKKKEENHYVTTKKPIQQNA